MKKKSVKKTKLDNNKKHENYLQTHNTIKECKEEEKFISLNDTLKLLLEMGHNTNNNIQIIAECISTIQNEIIKIKEENNELKKRLRIGE